MRRVNYLLLFQVMYPVSFVAALVILSLLVVPRRSSKFGERSGS